MVLEKDFKNEIKGFSFIWGKRIFHCGRYSYGYWFDRCTLNHQKERIGWGMKFDIAFGNIIRPIPSFWKAGFYTRKPTIQEVLDKGEDEFTKYFGEQLANDILSLDPHHYPLRSAHNPWYAKYWFVLRIISRWIPWPSFSIGTPLISFHIGSKGMQGDPFTRDITWCSKKEEELAVMYDPKDRFHALAISWTIRNHRY
jgi:hypothetical protein